MISTAATAVVGLTRAAAEVAAAVEMAVAVVASKLSAA